VFDRRAELAFVMSDHAHEVFGLGRIRLCFEDTPAKRFGVRKSLTSVTLGNAERVVDGRRRPCLSYPLHRHPP
jgi:hypothetical protein